MKTIRNLAFLLLCLVAFGAQRVTAGAFDCGYWWCDNPGEWPTEANGCDFEIQWFPDIVACPIAEYTGSCPWEVGCLDAHAAAEAICGWWEGVTPGAYFVEGFICDDPLDPPTEFSFRCDFGYCIE